MTPLEKKTLNINSYKGFTLIELLVVIAIIAMLSSIVLVSISTARARSRDIERTRFTNEMQKALELYYDDFEKYPMRDNAYNSIATAECGGTYQGSPWNLLELDLEPYYDLPCDPLGPNQTDYVYTYDSDEGDDWQTYGVMVRFEDSSNFQKIEDDGGWYDSSKWGAKVGEGYEVGMQPSYCASQYSGWNGTWNSGGAWDRCAGGN